LKRAPRRSLVKLLYRFDDFLEQVRQEFALRDREIQEAFASIMSEKFIKAFFSRFKSHSIDIIALNFVLFRSILFLTVPSVYRSCLGI